MTGPELLLLIALAGSLLPGGRGIGKQAYCLATSGTSCAQKAAKHHKHKHKKKPAADAAAAGSLK